MPLLFESEELRLLHFAGLLALVIYSSRKFANAFSPDERPEARVMKVVLLGFTQIVLTVLLLGSIGALGRLGVTLVGLAFFGLSLILRPRVAAESPRPQARSARPFQEILALAAVSLLGLILLSEIFLPPLATDGLIYHLTFPAEWIQARSLVRTATFFHEPAPTYSPMNAEFYFAWLMLPFGSDLAARLGQVPFLLAAGLSLYLLLTEFGFGKNLSFVLAVLFCLTRTFLHQMNQANNDLVSLTFFFAFLYFSQRLNKGERASGFFTGLSLGLFLGTKYIALAYLPGMALVLVVSLLFRPGGRSASSSRPRGSDLRLGFGSILKFLALVFLVGGYSYARNWIATGNPFYPADLSFLGFRIFKGMLDPSKIIERHYQARDLIRTLIVSAPRAKEAYIFTLPAYLGWVLLAGFFLSLFKLLIRFYRRENLRQTLQLVTVLAALPIISFLLFLDRVPFHDARLLFPVYGLLFVNLGFLLEGWFKRRPAGFLVTLALIGITIIETRLPFGKGFGLKWIVAFLALGGSWLLAKWLWRRSVSRKFCILALAVALAAAAYVGWDAYVLALGRVRGRLYARHYGDIGKGWEWIEKETSGRPVTLAHAGSPMIYPLFGSALLNHILYIPVQKSARRFFHEYNVHYDRPIGNSLVEKVKELYRSDFDYEAWMERIADSSVDYLFLFGRERGGEELTEKRWARQHSERFQLVYEYGEVEIYRIRPLLASLAFDLQLTK